MFTYNPESFKKISLEKTEDYIKYFDTKLITLKSNHSEDESTVEINIDYKNEVTRLEETIWCLHFGLSSLFEYYELFDATLPDSNINQKETFYCMNEKLQNKIIAYLSFLDYVYIKLGPNIRKARGANTLRSLFYPYICDTRGMYNEDSIQINVFLYLLIKNKFKGLNKFISKDLNNFSVYFDLVGDSNRSNLAQLKDTHTKNEHLKEYFLRKEHSSNKQSTVINIDSYEKKLDAFMSKLLKETTSTKKFHLTYSGYEINEFTITDEFLNKQFHIPNKHFKTPNKRSKSF